MNETVLVKGNISKLNIPALIFLFLGYACFGSMFFAITGAIDEDLIPVILIFAMFFIATGLFFTFLFARVEITVTDMRVYGKAAFGKRVDLPIDMISAVGQSSFSSVHIATSSGKLTFYNCKNRNEVYETISGLLIKRQQKSTTSATTVINQEIQQSNADELKKYKELLDQGIITQEEFDAKKKQLLNL